MKIAFSTNILISFYKDNMFNDYFLNEQMSEFCYPNSNEATAFSGEWTVTFQEVRKGMYTH